MNLISRRVESRSIAEMCQAISKAVSDPSRILLQRVANEYCMEQAKYDPNGLMQFRYKGEIFKLEDDKINLRALPLHPVLVERFDPHFALYHTDMIELRQKMLWYLSDVSRLAATQEDLYKLLPEAAAPIIDSLSFITNKPKNQLTDSQVEEVRTKYAELIDNINYRLFLGGMVETT